MIWYSLTEDHIIKKAKICREISAVAAATTYSDKLQTTATTATT